VRLRPIILTSVTTVFGLIPMATGLGGKSPIWMPLASTIIFGLSASIFLTLFIMPALYAMTEDFRALFIKQERHAFVPVVEEIPAGAKLADD
jgi:Cu/Ag efflux pump CusA